jgi:hypothetical protein
MSVFGMRSRPLLIHFLLSQQEAVMACAYHRHNGGHYPGHLRDAFIEAIEAYRNWESGTLEPTVEVEFGYVPRQMTLTQVCGLMWNCTDVLPSIEVSELERCSIEVRMNTYAAAARAMKSAIENTTQPAE